MDIPRRQRQQQRHTAAPALNALTLATPSIAENTAAGVTISGIVGQTAGSMLALVDDAGGRFALSGASLVAGPVVTDYESAPSHAITIRETLAGAANSPRDSVLTLAVTDVPETPALSGHLAMGDSWTWAGGGYADRWSAANPSIGFSKIASPGWGTADLQAKVADAAALSPRSISILIGFNNLQATTAETFLSNLQTLVASLKAAIPSVRVFVSTVPPSGSHANVNPRRAIANPAIRAGSGDWHDGVIPIGDYLADADAGDGVAHTDYYNNSTPPGHPTALLDGIMAAILGAVLDPFHAGATAASPSAFTFPDIPGAPAGQTYTQWAAAPLTGMAAGQAATAVHSGSGTFQRGRAGASGTSSKTVYNGDWLAVTSTAGSYPPVEAVDNTITIGTTAETFTVTTGPLANDDFNRANGAPGTTPVGGLAWIGPAQISGNKLVLGQANSGYGALDPGVGGVDYTVDVTVPSSGLGNMQLMMLGKKVATSNDWRNAFGRCYILDLAAGTLKLRHETFGLLGLATFTGLGPGTYTIRVVARTSNRTINVYNGGALLVSATYANDGAVLPQGSWIGVLDSFQNSNIAIDNLSVVAA